MAESDLYWDRIVAIERVGLRETYDLSVEGDHNFIANDLVVHNSHAASFALLAYASAYLKAHHPAAFYAALLNNQPMGFYHPATIVGDAARHGQAIRPVDINHSDSAMSAGCARRRGGSWSASGRFPPPTISSGAPGFTVVPPALFHRCRLTLVGEPFDFH